MITDSRLLAELHEVKNSQRVFPWLQERREAAVIEVKNSKSDRDCAIAIGRMRELDEVIEAIETALDVFEALKAKERNKVDVQKTF